MKALRSCEPYLHLYTLCALVLAHPLLTLLARYPEFFTARGWGTGEVWLLTGTLVFVLPAGPAAAYAVLERRGERLAAGFLTAFVALAAAGWLAQLLRGWRVGSLVLAVAAAGGGLIAVSYRRYAHVRTFLSFLAPAVLAVPLVFVTDERLTRLGEPPATEAEGLEIPARSPIFFIVFDALSATALMDESQQINPRRYPHLAALAADSLWYPNATSVARWTLEAVPAILTGDFPRRDQLAQLADHPRNLFTLLNGSYSIVADEAAMELCPPQLNAYPRPAPPDDPWTVASDLGLIWLHRTLPAAYAKRLPPVDQGWGHFADPRGRVGGEIGRFYRFLDTFEADAPPTLYYLHVVFPHMPYQYLPSGKTFRDRVSPHLRPATGDRRPAGEATRTFLYKRYLFQVGLVDRMVGDLTARLRQLELYDRSYVILTADHGGRTTASDFLDDVFAVPLIVKRPGPTGGAVDPRPVSTLDLLPSLLDLLGAPAIPFQGSRRRSFLATDYQPPSQIFDSGTPRPLAPDFHERKLELVTWKLDRFGRGDDPLSLYRAGSTRPELLGEPVSAFTLRDEPRLSVELDLGGPEIRYHPDASFAPILIAGSLHLDAPDEECCELAVTLNGRVEATTRARPHQPPGWLRFRCTLAESLWRPGDNEVRVFSIDPEDPRLLWAPRQRTDPD